MKQYIKPEINSNIISLNSAIASAGLSDWLDDNLGNASKTITVHSYTQES